MEYPSGETRTFEFDQGAVYSPLNCKYRILTVRARALRLSCTNDAPLVINLFHNEKFVFENDFDFPERLGADGHLKRESICVSGDNVAEANLWETNFVNDLPI